jgi:transcriptional regulator GlxA family with amidase domain
MRVEILVFPGFDELDALGPLEVVRNAARHDGKLEVALVTMDGESVTGGHGVRVGVDHAISEGSDLLVVPGGGWNDRSPAGVRTEVEKGTIPAALSAAHQRGTTVAGVCTPAAAR